MMNIRKLTVAAMVLALSGLAIAEPTQQDNRKDADKEKPTEVKWRTDYNTARKEAADRKRPIVLVFYNSVSPPSHRLLIEISHHAELSSFLNSRTVPLKIEKGRDEGNLASMLGIDRYPTLVLADSDGKIRDTIVGYQDPNELLAKLRKTFP